MDTGENKLNAEMMKKLYEAHKLNTKKKIDEFNEAAQKIISDKEYPEAEEVLKLVEGTLITDDHERRIHDPSICKYRGKQVLHSFFDEPYPVMMPEDVETMKGISEDLMRKFRESVSKELGEPPRPTITIDSNLLYDRHGNGYYIMSGSSRCLPGKTWLWLNMLMERLRYNESLEISRCDNVMKKEIDINSVIHWNHSKPDYLKCIKVRYSLWGGEYKYVMDSPIDILLLETLERYYPEMIDKSTPNINVDDKKKLERVVNKRRKNK